MNISKGKNQHRKGGKMRLEMAGVWSLESLPKLIQQDQGEGNLS